MCLCGGAAETTEKLKGVKSPDMKMACGCSPSMWSLVCSESPCNEIMRLQTMKHSTASDCGPARQTTTLFAFLIPRFSFSAVPVVLSTKHTRKKLPGRGGAADETHVMQQKWDWLGDKKKKKSQSKVVLNRPVWNLCPTVSHRQL